MDESGPGAPPTDKPLPPAEPAMAVVERSRSLLPQIIVIAAAAALLSVLVAIDAMSDPESVGREEAFALNCVASVIGALAHAMWISLDCRRRGVEVGWWRFGAIIFGPLAIWAYLVAAYRAKALLWIPVSVAVYLAVWAAPTLTWLVIDRIR